MRVCVYFQFYHWIDWFFCLIRFGSYKKINWFTVFELFGRTEGLTHFRSIPGSRNPCHVKTIDKHIDGYG